MSALEAYANGIALELAEGSFKLTLNEIALISEKEIIFDNGNFQL